MTPYVQGQHAASCFLGIDKIAAPLFTPRPGMLSRVGRTLKKWAPTWAGTKKMMIGEPGKFKDEIVNRKLLSKGSLIREGFRAPGMLNKALFYGMPALDMVSVARSDSPDKAGDIASIIGGSAMGMAAFRPLGMLGAMAAGTAGAALGRGAVHGGQKLLGQQPAAPPPPPEQPTVPYNQFYPYAPGANYAVGGV
jgi:hypothetical protein